MPEHTPPRYRAHLARHLIPFIEAHPDARGRIAALSGTALGLTLLDLEPVRDDLAACYDAAHPGGRPPRDPVCMLRALILMALLGEHRLNAWVDALHGRPELRILCGFALTRPDGAHDPGPGVATFYDFMARLLDGPPPARSARTRWTRPSIRRRGAKFLRHIGEEKRRRKASRPPIKRMRMVAKQVTEAAAARGYTSRLHAFAGRMQQILGKVAIARSAKMGLLPRLLDIAADGSAIRTHARPAGRRPDEPVEEGHRHYSDPEATWGFDATRDRYYFGHKAHAFVVRTKTHELPLRIDIGAAHEPDGVLAALDLHDLAHLLAEHAPACKVRSIIADAAYDAEAFYTLVDAIDAAPVIALNPANPVRNTPDTDADGVPLCPGGCRMRRFGHNKRRGVITYNCPAKRPTRRGGEHLVVFHPDDCPLEKPREDMCDPHSKLGPLVHIRPGDNPRANLRIPRGSALFEALYRKRTAVERFFSVLKVRGKWAQRPYRRRFVYQMMGTAHAIAVHVRAWVDHRFGAVPKDAAALIEALGALCEEEAAAA